MVDNNSIHALDEKVVSCSRTSVSQLWDETDQVLDFMNSNIDPDHMVDVADVVCLRMNMRDRYQACPRTTMGQLVLNLTDDMRQINEIYDDGNPVTDRGCVFLDHCNNENCDTCLYSCVKVFDVSGSEISDGCAASDRRMGS
ncbi:MAG: hypothetical protein RBR71_11550 [Gudongella sp.]|nr:hypothetical protein [Gudongella sp.]